MRTVLPKIYGKMIDKGLLRIRVRIDLPVSGICYDLTLAERLFNRLLEKLQYTTYRVRAETADVRTGVLRETITNVCLIE
jgi:hypothetical protein